MEPVEGSLGILMARGVAVIGLQQLAHAH